MPSIGKKSNGSSKTMGGSKGAKKGSSLQMGRGKKSQGFKPRKAPVDVDDTPLSPDEEVVETEVSGQVSTSTVGPAEPFSDGLVSAKLKGLVVVPRVGGEEVTVLHDFLEMYSRTEPYIGTISSKTSFMKKSGGRLL